MPLARSLTLTLLISLLLLAVTRAAPAESPEELRSNFLDPPIAYHTVPAWWWDGGDEVTIERVSWQLEQLKSQGIDVVCLIHHVPLNLKPQYQTEKWWEVYRKMVEKAASLDMKIWISDGIGWGSPLINNTVLEEDPSYLGQILAHLEGDVSGPGRIVLEIPKGPQILEILGAYAYPRQQGEMDLEKYQDLSHLVRGRELVWNAPAGDWTAMLFYSQPGYTQEGSNFQSFIGPGRGAPLDYMNPKAMKRLLEVTLGEYEKHLGDYIGKTVVATFQDELLTTQGSPPISPLLFSSFRERKGYDLIPYLGALFREAGRLTPKVRCDYFDVRVQLLEEAFFKPEYQWYQNRGMMIAHDQFGRRSLISQISQYGDYFRTMRWYQAPGSDDWHEARSGRNLRDLKMAASIAHLYERPRVFSEALHTSGWGLTMEQQRQVVNEEYAIGVNLYDEVGFNYTTHGSWFEWAPAATMFRQPYFKHKRVFNDYVNRLSFVMSQGKHVADAAILYPVTSLQANIGGGSANDKAQYISSVFFQLMEKLFYDGIDYDIIDEDSLQRADVSRGQLEVAGESFKILLLPPLTAIHRASAEQIRRFYENGGSVIGGTFLPVDSPEAGAGDELISGNFREIFAFEPEILNKGSASRIQRENQAGGKAFFLAEGFSDITQLMRANYQIDFDTDLPEILVNHRRIGDRDFYLIYNGADKPARGWVKCRVKGRPEIWNVETGAIDPVFRFREDGPYTALELELEPYDARLVALSGGSAGPSVKAANLADTDIVRENSDYAVSGPWRFSIEPTLDNQWGDFRLPVTEQDRMIGAEIRQFLYRQEADSEDGEQLGWAAADCDITGWDETVYTVGPYWWVIPPIPSRGGPAYFDRPFIPEQNIDTQKTYQHGDRILRWQPYSFSQQFGIHKDVDYYRSFGVGHHVNVSQNYFDLGSIESFATAYAYTHVFSPRAMNVLLKTNAAGYMEPFRLWVNNEVVSDRYLMGPMSTVPIAVKQGWNEILLKLMQFPAQGPRRMRFYVHLIPEDEALGREKPRPSGPSGGPRLTWFTQESPFIYDLTPELKKRVGWYRFELPPGTAEIHLDLYGRARAFVDGEEIPVSEDGIGVLRGPVDEGAVCALRIEQAVGRYAGAAFRSPVRLKLTEGAIRLGDWSKKGLLSYSGIGVYKTEVEVPAFADGTGWALDLGEVATSAEVLVNGKSAGIRAWSPYRFDVGEFLKRGKNNIEVKVANTLANHGLIGTAWVYIYEGTERSGLIGPVTLHPSKRVGVQLNEGKGEVER